MMMRLWATSYAKRAPILSATVFSLCAHTLVIAGWVAATRPPSSISSESIANRMYYIPPPDREQQPLGSRESVHYITLAEGLGRGPGPAIADARRPVGIPEQSPDVGSHAVDSVAASPVVGDKTGDSVFTVLEVDSAVARSQNSAAPAYPLDLVQKHIEGGVIVRYVVDTTGFADTTSFEVIKSTNDGFVRAVRDALPYMRFAPAKIGARKVRQLVEQPFTFRIAPGVAAGKKPASP